MAAKPSTMLLLDHTAGSLLILVVRVLEDLSRTIRAAYSVNGSHCMDLLPSQKGDPDWLVNQRKTKVRIIRRWIDQYYAELKN
ncbi:hypothetical protein CDL15_Pgr025137 [Punica granatum]|uniref:Uncharacterized protein n=1 Tax=Punica granatum TaxID=22663 RepID=A0A218W9D3_PUNGR|nr:hypothetical protein CDL15_Pgr025137 [Punica granatum]